MFTELSAELKNNVKNIQKQLNSSSEEADINRCEHCLNSLGYSREDVKDSKKMKEFLSRIKVYAEMEQSYSDNPKVNKDMKKLEVIVKEYVEGLKQYFTASGNDKLTNEKGEPIYKDVLEFNEEGRSRDMIARHSQKNTHFVEGDDLFDSGNPEIAHAFGDKVVFGVGLNDWTIIHEFIHIIAKGGLQQKVNLSKVEAPLSNHLNKNQMFDEVITDYFTKMICNTRQLKNVETLYSDEKLNSAYSLLFPIMGEFIENHAQQIIESLLEGFDVVYTDKIPTKFQCNCSKERVTSAIVSVGKAEIQNMIDDGDEIEVNCHFCNSNYKFSVEELKELLEAAK